MGVRCQLYREGWWGGGILVFLEDMIGEFLDEIRTGVMKVLCMQNIMLKFHPTVKKSISETKIIVFFSKASD